MTIDFNGQAVVITGGASGIGLALARQFGREGARVLIADLAQDKVDAALAQLREADVEAHGTTCDVADRAQVEQLADHAWQLFGSVDAIVNNAGIGSVRSTVIDARREDIDRVLGVNLFGVWNGVSVFGSRFLEQGTSCGISGAC